MLTDRVKFILARVESGELADPQHLAVACTGLPDGELRQVLDHAFVGRDVGSGRGVSEIGRRAVAQARERLAAFWRDDPLGLCWAVGRVVVRGVPRALGAGVLLLFGWHDAALRVLTVAPRAAPRAK